MRLKMAVRMCGAGRGAPPSQPIDRTGIIALIDELDHLPHARRKNRIGNR
jgi:hypothetical protein